jgi:hypothetical protein
MASLEKQSAARKTIEIYEIQSRSSPVGSWKPAKQQFASKDGIGCVHMDVLPVAPGYEWAGDWQLDLSNANGAGGVGETDEEGWDYATSANRFGPGKGAHRIPRIQGLKDVIRRRRWIRSIRPILAAAPTSLNSTPEAKQEMVRVLLDGLARAQREVEKMGSRLGTRDDSEEVRSTIQDYLAKVKLAQGEVQRRIELLDGDAAIQQGRRALSKTIAPFETVEDDIARKLLQPVSMGGRGNKTGPGGVASGGPGVSRGGPGSVSGGGPGSVSGGNGRFVPGMDGGGGGGWKQSDGEYVSRQQQEQALESRLRAVGEEEVDLAIMQEREVHINKVAENVQVLNELFKDMAELVQSQQTGIDAIETNVESAAVRTQAGVVHLEAALEHQKACVIS